MILGLLSHRMIADEQERGLPFPTLPGITGKMCFQVLNKRAYAGRCLVPDGVNRVDICWRRVVVGQ